jgi:hypothetical protein
VWILQYLQAQQINKPSDIVGETACLACSMCQIALTYGNALGGCSLSLGFAAVLAHGQPLVHPLASIWFSKPHVASGLFNALPVPGALWS